MRSSVGLLMHRHTQHADCVRRCLDACWWHNTRGRQRGSNTGSAGSTTRNPADQGCQLRGRQPHACPTTFVTRRLVELVLDGLVVGRVLRFHLVDVGGLGEDDIVPHYRRSCAAGSCRQPPRLLCHFRPHPPSLPLLSSPFHRRHCRMLECGNVVSFCV